LGAAATTALNSSASSAARTATAPSSEIELQREFDKLMQKLGVQHLKLVWRPDLGRDISGEVRNGTLYVYEEDQDKALDTVKHELIDYLITSKLVKPLVEMINLLIKSRESDIYREKEKIVEALIRMLV
jgi:hypothetical protein